jgi:hypothetical protein
LTDGVHTCIIRSAVAPDSFVVGRERPLPWVWTLAPALLTVALACAGALMMLEIGKSVARR